ncbi:hypothetical protein BDW22DRAFT_1484251 [Trametopsis cervina]|nr:hypothetical protein BDW22DRAFT_1484251 [Trametopsis cervina]
MSFAGFGKTSGSLFGQNTTGTQPQTSIFGNTTQQQQTQPQQNNSLFGGSLLGQQPQQNQQAQQPITTPSLFGSGFGQTQPQQQQQQQPPQQQTTQPSLFAGFGQNNQQNNNQAQQGQQSTNSLFSTQTQQSNPLLGQGLNSGNAGNPFGQSTNGFGVSQLQRQPTQQAFPGSTNSFFKPPAQQHSLGMQQSTSAPLFLKSTKFNDLPEEVKRTLENIDTHIQGRVQISNDLKQRKLGEEATKGQEFLRSVHKELVSAITVLQNDVHHTRDLKTKTDQTVQDTIITTRIIDGFRNPQQNGQYLKTYASFPLEFFERVTEDMRSRLRWYKSTIEQIERKLSSVAAQVQPTPHAIASTLQAQHAIFVALANKTAALDAELQKIKALYTQLWRAKTGSRRDPFNELDRGTGGEFGLDSLSGK